MWQSPSLILRIAIGKGLGLLFGLIGFFLLPMVMPNVEPMLQWGLLLWYPTVGAFIGVLGVFTYHPVLKLPMPWWFRAPLVGAWMNFVLVLFTYDKMADIMVAFMGSASAFTSPFWLVAEGAIIGLIIGFAATKLGGEGKETV